MNTTQTDELTFKRIIEKSGAELTGVDVGRTHGIQTYTRNGKYVGCARFTRGYYDDTVWTYEVVNYLIEAYK